MAGIATNLLALKRTRAGPQHEGARRMAEVRAFGPNPGELGMFGYVPDDLKRGAPLVVVLHGCTQTAEAHADAAGWLSLAARCGFAVLAPEQRATNNSNRCFNWFEPADTARERGEAASIRAMIAHMIKAHGLDADSVFITGLSAGGAMTSVMLAAYPEVFAGGAIIAGLPFGAADDLPSAFGAMRGRSTTTAQILAPRSAGAKTPRISVWHGDADYTVSAVNAGQIARQWVDVHALEFEAGDSETLGRRERTVWRAPHSGEIVVETNIIRGLGHGTPLSTLGEGGVGSVAPYMLEVEISAVTEIARFWGLAPPDVLKHMDAGVSGKTALLGDSILASVAGRASSNVQKVIANALRQAGLMQ